MDRRKRKNRLADATVKSEWFDILAAANSGDADEVPAGWKTVREIAAETGFSDHHVWKRLRSLHEAGKIERRRFRICTGTTIRPVLHYNHGAGS